MAPLDFNAPTAEETAEIRRRKAAITRRIRREVLAELGLDRLPKQGERDSGHRRRKAPARASTAAETIASLEGDVVIWWLVPTLDKAEEQAAEYRALATRRA